MDHNVESGGTPDGWREWLTTEGAPSESAILRAVRVEDHTLVIWETGQTTCNVGTRPTHWSVGYAFFLPDAAAPLFCGTDIGIPMMGGDALDSDAVVRSVLGWLTLRPGDTDAEFFERYSAEQRAFAESNACESLTLWTLDPSDSEDENPPAFTDLSY